MRARARFCPQCGQQVAEEPVTEKSRAPENREATSRASSAMGSTTRIETEVAAQKEDAAQPSAKEQLEQQRRRGAVKVMAETAREKVEERIGPRVEKIRQASNVVIDEAAEDPEVRFLLIAAVIFVLFVVIFLVTTVFIK